MREDSRLDEGAEIARRFGERAILKNLSWTRPENAAVSGVTIAGVGLAVCLLFLAATGDAITATADGGSPADCSSVDYATRAPQPIGEGDESAVVEPPNPNGPTIVGVGFHVNDIRGIDPVNNQFEFRGYIQALWCDPRLAFDPETEGQSERIFTGEQAAREMTRVWFPAGYPVNQVGELKDSERVLHIRHDGTVEQNINVSVPLSTDFDLRRFPFDRQTLELQVESFIWNRDHLRFVHDESISGFREGISIPEWNIETVVGHVKEASVMKSDIPFDRYVLEIGIARKPGFYLWKVFLPLVLIVALSWSVFWMTDERFSNRSRISATGVLTIVAYQFAFAKDLPRIGYLTLLDQIMIGSFVLLAVTVVESLLVDRANASDPLKAHRIDRTSRWIFPAVYVLMLVTIGLLAG
jgi:hypothetical protein